jgi:hypothetical protein
MRFGVEFSFVCTQTYAKETHGTLPFRTAQSHRQRWTAHCFVAQQNALGHNKERGPRGAKNKKAANEDQNAPVLQAQQEARAKKHQAASSHVHENIVKR